MFDIGTCTKCNRSFRELAVLALMADFGAKGSCENVDKCLDGEDHDFKKEEEF